METKIIIRLIFGTVMLSISVFILFQPVDPNMGMESIVKVSFLVDSMPLLTDVATGKEARVDNTDILFVDASDCLPYQVAVLKNVKKAHEEDVNYQVPEIVVHSTKGIGANLQNRALMLKKISGLSTQFYITNERMIMEEHRTPVVFSSISHGVLSNANAVVPLASSN